MTVRIAAIEATLESVKIQISRAKSRGAQLVVLGEMFACAYSHKAFIELAEPVELIGKSGYAALGKIGQFLSDQARTHQLWIIGGSLPESHKTEKTESFFNTSLVFNDRGEIVQKYRKLHLFDVSIPAPVGSGKPSVRFCESDTLSPGDLGIGLCETPWGFQIGLGICYDIRFPELAVSLREKSDGNMKLLVYPGQFNMITGPLHWQLLGRARAVDTQSFCVLASVARSADSSDYQSWGHSAIISPQGGVLAEMGEEEGFIVADIDMSEVDSMRASIPTYLQKRKDVY